MKELLIPFRVAVLNFPADHGLPEPHSAPERDRSQEIEQPCPSLCTHVAWDKSAGVWRLDADCVGELKEHGIHLPTSYFFQYEAIRALQMCGPYHLLCTYIYAPMHAYAVYQ